MEYGNSCFDFIFLQDYEGHVLEVAPEYITSIIPIKTNKCLIYFAYNEPKLVNHSLYEVINKINTFYNANK
jgi:hypothetical protein